MDANLPLRLELMGITKRFPGVLASESDGFSVLPGEIPDDGFLPGRQTNVEGVQA